MRKRSKQLLLRVSDDEYAQIKKLINDSGQSTQEYLRAAVFSLKLSTAEEIEELKKLNITMSVISDYLGECHEEISTMVYWADMYEEYEAKEQIKELLIQLKRLRKDFNAAWLFQRSYLADRKQ